MANIPISLNGGVFIRQMEYPTVKSHLDSSNLFEFFGNNKEVTNLGMVDYFANKGYLPQNMTRMGTVERKFLDSHEFMYSYPTAQKEFYVVEDLSLTDKPGIGRSKFRAKFNTRKYDNLWIVTPDTQLPVSLYVTEDEIERDGDGWIYTFGLLGENVDGRHWKKEFLAPGVKYFGTGTLDSEYNQTRSSIPEFSGGKRDFMSWVGYDSQQLHYSITREAAKTPVPGSNLRNYDAFLETVQTFQFVPGSLGYELSMKSPEEKLSFGNDVTRMYNAAYGSAMGERQMATDSLLNVWAPKVEMLGMKLLAQNIETQAYYSSGGTVNVDGPTDAKRALGLFHQYMLGNTSNYNIGHMTREFLETIAISRIQGKEPYSPDGMGPEIVLRTGKGGLSIVHNFLKGLPAQYALLWTTDNIVQNLGGNNRNLHFASPRFNSWMSDAGVRFRVEYEPSLDPETANHITNPIVPVNAGVGGFRLSSYIFIIEDLTGNNTDGGESNVCELLYRPDWQLRQSYTNGKLAYPGSEDANGRWHRIPGIAGFDVTLEMRNKAYWLKDPTKSLVIKPIDPFTGKPIFEYR
jgi:hypothetical protein